jgi:hypothetical protein
MWWIIPVIILLTGIVYWAVDANRSTGSHFASGTFGFLGFLVSIFQLS